MIVDFKFNIKFRVLYKTPDYIVMFSYVIISKIIQSKYNITLFCIFILVMTIVYNSLNLLVHFSLHSYNICYTRFIIVNLIMYIVLSICL